MMTILKKRFGSEVFGNYANAIAFPMKFCNAINYYNFYLDFNSSRQTTFSRFITAS